jgi:hypothetical protein
MPDTSRPKLYARRDTEAIGEHYIRHVWAMTAEGLHEKSDIAAELAWRDAEIEHLRKIVGELLDDSETELRKRE